MRDKTICPVCEKSVTVRSDGRIWRHKRKVSISDLKNKDIRKQVAASKKSEIVCEASGKECKNVR